jgi:hypothetical protein
MRLHRCLSGWSYATRLGRKSIVQPGDDETAMRESIDALDEISEDVSDAKRGTIADMVLGEYFA